ncbi:MAG: bacteriohopanetetrol glucosamine biosynthesis glycosyltransferase HpnI [Pseudolabrys sp.]
MAAASVLTLRFGRDAAHAAASSAPPVTVLVPLCGAEPGLYSRLGALCEQDYPAPVQVLCAIQDPDDPAVAVVEKLAADCPQAAVDWQVDPGMHGRNRKMSNMINAIGRARHDVLVMIDSDIEVGRDHLSRVVGELQQPNVGAVTCLYTGVADDGLWARLSAKTTNLHFLPGVIVGLKTNLAEPCFGSTIALTRATLERIGGLEAFVDNLWDDYAIGQAVRAAGLEVRVSAVTVGHVCPESTGRAFFAYQLRNARTIGGIDPVGYFGSVVTHPFALALCALPLGVGEPAVVLAGLALASRMALCRCVTRRFGVRSSYWLLPLHDIAAFAVYVMSFFGGTIMWRGQRYRLQSDGTLLQTSH